METLRGPMTLAGRVMLFPGKPGGGEESRAAGRADAASAAYAPVLSGPAAAPTHPHAPSAAAAFAGPVLRARPVVVLTKADLVDDPEHRREVESELNRKLSFLKHPDLLRVLENLDSEESVRGALEAAGVEENLWPAFMGALATLEESEMVRARA